MAKRRRKAKPKCNWADCFTCPYPDCIDANRYEATSLNKRNGPGRPKLPPGVVKEHQRQWRKKHYRAHKEELLAKSRAYYAENRDKVKAQQKRYRDSKKGVSDGVCDRQTESQSAGTES